MNILLPLSITLAIETGIYMILKHKDFKLLILVTILNLILNTGMNVGLSYISDTKTHWIVLTACEIATIGIESLVIFLVMKIKYPKVLLFSFIANASSFLIGWSLSLTGIYQTKIAAPLVCSLFFTVHLFTFVFVLVSTIIAYRDRNDNGGRN